jgi:hypothetical protein
MKVLLFLTFGVFAFAQNSARDTLMLDGSQPATILKINQHKVTVLKKSPSESPYTLQKDGSFVLNATPKVTISVSKSKKGSPRQYLEHIFQTTELENGESKSVAPREEYPFYTRMSKKGNLLIFDTLYAMKDELLAVQCTFSTQSPKDEYKLSQDISDFLWNSILISENFYAKELKQEPGKK